MSADNQPATQTEEGMDTDSDNHNSVATEGSENITVSSRAINPGEWTITRILRPHICTEYRLCGSVVL